MGLYRDETGRIIDVDDRFAEARGYEAADAIDTGNAIGAAADQARGEERGVLGEINAAGTGFFSGLTMGGTDYLLGKTLTPLERERVLAESEAHPYLRAGGEIAGALTGALAAPGSALSRTPTGYLSALATEGVEAGLAQGGIAGTAKALGIMGTEGAVQSAGAYIGHSALEDKEVTAEGLNGALGTGFAFGALGGGAALGVAKGAMAARRLYSRVMDGEKAAKAAESTWSQAAQEAFEADQANVRAAEAKVDTISKAKQAAQRGRNEARAMAQEERIRAAAYEKPVAESDFEAGVPTDVIPRDEKLGGMPTSVFRRGEEAVGPEPLIGDISQPQGEATSVFKKPNDSASAAKVETDLEAQLRGTKAELDKGKSIKEVGENAVPGSPVSPQIPPGKKPPETPGRNPSRSIEDFLAEKRAVDERPGKNPELMDARERQMELMHKLGGDAQIPPAQKDLKPYSAPRPDFGEQFKPTKQQRFGKIRNFLGEELDVGPLSGRKAGEMQGPKISETLAEMRYKATEDLLGPEIAKQERKLNDLVEEFHAARKDVEELLAPRDFADSPIPVRDTTGFPSTVEGGGIQGREGASTGSPAIDAWGQSAKTGAGSPRGRRNAMAILDDAHEEALLRAKYAADPQEAGQAVTEAEELEKLLEGLSVPRVVEKGTPLSRSEMAHMSADAMAEEIKKVERYEKASAALADELGDTAHPHSQMRRDGLREAERESERKVNERTARAVDDAETFGPEYKTPKERVAYARSRQNEAQSRLDEMKVQHEEAVNELSAAKKKVREGEKAKKAALREDARLAKAANASSKFGAQDLGGLMEVLDVPGLPKPSDLPVVGPLLGAYLKFRTLKKALGRFAGKVPATADNRVAALANQTRDRIARAVDRSLGVLERGAKTTRRAVPAVAGILSSRIYDDGHEAPPKNASIQKLAAARMREINALVTTPGAIERQVRLELRGVTDPDVISAAEKARRYMMEYIQRTMPKVPDQGILNQIEWEPSPAEAMSFARRLEAANDPAGVFERLAHEQAQLSLEAAEVMRDAYPKLFQQAQQRVLERASESRLQVPFRTRVQMAVLYKLPQLEPSLDPANFQITQSVYERKPSSPAYNPAAPVANANTPPTAAPSIANPVDVSQAYMPAADRNALRR